MAFVTDQGTLYTTQLPASGTGTAQWQTTPANAAYIRAEVRHAPAVPGLPGPLTAFTNPVFLAADRDTRRVRGSPCVSLYCAAVFVTTTTRPGRSATMTVVDDRITDDGTDDRIEMAEHRNSEHTLDTLFEWLERTAPEGYRIDIVEGGIFMTPQRSIHWDIIRGHLRTIEDQVRPETNPLRRPDRLPRPPQRLLLRHHAGVRGGRSSTARGASSTTTSSSSPRSSRKALAANDYGPKRIAYAKAEIPVYLIADPYQGKCHVYTQPKKGDYVSELRVPFGNDIDLTGTVVGLVLPTDEFPRE